MTRYSLAPFFELTGWSMKRVTTVAPCNGVEYGIRLSDGVTDRIADRLAVAAGYHPHEIWPELEALAAVACAGSRCSERFVPLRKSHRFCSKECFQREWKRDRYRQRYASDPEFRARERARSRARRDGESPRVTKVKKAAWYQRNRERILADRQAERDARKPQAARGEVAA